MAFKKQHISLEETKQFSKLFLDYLNGNENLRSFYTYPPALASFKQALLDKAAENTNRDLLATVISEQYSSTNIQIKDFQNVQANLDLLKDKKTFTVCTGHQLCLFTGPLYFIFKLISTVNLAERLKKEYPDHNFIPLYWMASEDHDFEEISSVNLFGRKVTWGFNTGGAVGRLKAETLAPVIEELKQTFGESENANELITLFTNAYLKHDTIAAATRYMVHSLFAEYGLLILDADDVRLKIEFSPYFQDDILNHTNFKMVSESIKSLNEFGYEAQVNPREINIFRLDKNARVRIEKTDKASLTLEPGMYSPNVVLRPLYQQFILPNVAYVGGPGEIAYWLEYKKMFDHHKIAMPVLMPRNFALLQDEKSVQQMEKLGINTPELFTDTEQLIKEFVAKHASADISLKDQEEKLRDMFRELADKVGAVDATLKANVEAEAQKALTSLKNIENKLIKSEKQKQETNINQIRKLKDKFLPGGVLQERHDNFSPYYLRSGKNLISDLKEAFDPFEFRMLILE